MVDDEERDKPKDYLTEEIRLLAQRIRKVAVQADPVRMEVVGSEQIVRYWTTREDLGDDETEGIDLYIIRVLPEGQGKYGWHRDMLIKLPPDFHYPIYMLDRYSYQVDEDQRLTTPYGVMNFVVVGKDRHIYTFRNLYLFSENNRGMKYEQVIQETEVPENEQGIAGLLEKNLITYDNSRVPRLNFAPRPTDSRFVRLDYGDIEKVHAALHEIQSERVIQN